MLNMFDNTTWFMLHLINAGASQQLAFSIDEHDLWVVSADGSYIVPHKVQVSTVTPCLDPAVHSPLRDLRTYHHAESLW